MHDQGIEARPSLDLENRCHGLVVGGIGAQPVDGFGRERHEFACAQQIRGLLDHLVAGGAARFEFYRGIVH